MCKDDKESLLIFEKKFGSRLFCKANEPQKLQLQKIELVAKLQRATGSEKLLDELLFQTKAAYLQVRTQAVKSLAKIANQAQSGQIDE